MTDSQTDTQLTVNQETALTPGQVQHLDRARDLIRQATQLSWDAADAVYQVIVIERGGDPAVVQAAAVHLKMSEPSVRKMIQLVTRFPVAERHWDVPYWAYEVVSKSDIAPQILDEVVEQGKTQPTNGSTMEGAAYTPAVVKRIRDRLEGRIPVTTMEKYHKRMERLADSLRRDYPKLTSEDRKTLRADARWILRAVDGQ